ncbi:MAG: hypothetical protein KC910_10845 [Candidatus Eremiobacteraeota bacterium]|nr:hypothetical protein [Candidatus Eremiobacteraeota bacterium]
MRPLLAVLFIASLSLAAQADQFKKSWGADEGLKAVQARLPAEAAQAAGLYWQQFDELGNYTSASTLRRYRQARRDWARLGPSQVSLLVKQLSSPQPWERYVSAVLLGGTHSPAAITPLRQRLAVENHRDVGYALEGALAELGDNTHSRLQRLLDAELGHRKESGRDAELRSIFLIQLVCNVHRPEAVEFARHLKSDDGGIAEVKHAALTHLLTDLTGVPRLVTKGRKVHVGKFYSTYYYPQLRDMVDTQLQTEINKQLEEAFPPKPYQWEDDYYELREFEVTRLDADYISVLYKSSGKLRSAGSHNRTFTTRNISLHNGRQDNYRDLFKADMGDTLAKLREIARPIADQKYQFKMAADFLDKEPRFYLTPKKLVLLDLFHDDQPTEVAVPIESLRELISPMGPLQE